MRPLLFLTLSAAIGCGPALAEGGGRVISLGGSVTEIIVALGAENRLVARDTTSDFPETVQALPDVGYIRALSAEGVLSLDPGLIIAEGDAGPPEAVEVLQAAGIPFLLMPEATTPDGVIDKITAVAVALDLPQEGAALAATVQARLDAAATRTASVTTPKRVLFVLSLQGGKVLAAGEGTEAEGIIQLAGGTNAATGFQGYKPMTDEAVLIAAPDAILMMDRGGEMEIVDSDVLSHPALSQTPAAQSGTILRMDGMLLLGFGPRLPEAIDALFAALYRDGA